jgi:hypothetical protein
MESKKNYIYIVSVGEFDNDDWLEDWECPEVCECIEDEVWFFTDKSKAYKCMDYLKGELENCQNVEIARTQYQFEIGDCNGLNVECFKKYLKNIFGEDVNIVVFYDRVFINLDKYDTYYEFCDSVSKFEGEYYHIKNDEWIGKA